MPKSPGSRSRGEWILSARILTHNEGKNKTIMVERRILQNRLSRWKVLWDNKKECT